jgi:hypothetical protein
MSREVRCDHLQQGLSELEDGRELGDPFIGLDRWIHPD